MNPKKYFNKIPHNIKVLCVAALSEDGMNIELIITSNLLDNIYLI